MQRLLCKILYVGLPSEDLRPRLTKHCAGRWSLSNQTFFAKFQHFLTHYNLLFLDLICIGTMILLLDFT